MGSEAPFYATKVAEMSYSDHYSIVKISHLCLLFLLFISYLSPPLIYNKRLLLSGNLLY